MNNLSNLNLEYDEFNPPNEFTKSLYSTLRSTDTNFKGLEILESGEKNITSSIKNFLSQNPKNIIEKVQQFQLKKFLPDEKNIILKCKDGKLFVNSKEIKSQVLVSVFTNMVLGNHSTQNSSKNI